MRPKVMVTDMSDASLLSKEERMEIFMEGRSKEGMGVMLESTPEFLDAMLNAIAALAHLGEQAERDAVWHTGEGFMKSKSFEIGPMYHSIMMAPYVLLCLHDDDEPGDEDEAHSAAECRMNTAIAMARDMWVPLMETRLRKHQEDANG